ncbi:MAG: DNA mismatch repair protein MutS [Glaciecola sp.]|jgi:DNA mismatch repair protein MutS
MAKKSVKTAPRQKPAETPLMKQYNDIKRKYPDAMLLFRVGDFYETFDTDAEKASKILGIVLTKRANGTASHVALAGFPHHSLDTYLPKLVKAGQRVAVCDQLENPKLTKNIVKRGVTELITPGVAISDQVLQQKENNYLAAVSFDKNKAGVAFLDVSTGEFQVAEGNHAYINKLLMNFQANEILFNKSTYKQFSEIFEGNFYTYGIDEWAYSSDYTSEKLHDFFGIKSLKGFGIDKMPLASQAAGVAIHYLSATHNNNVSHIRGIARIEEGDFLWMDYFTIKSLELVHSEHSDASTLLSVIDQTETAMGGRMLRKFLLMPLVNVDLIKNRQAKVGELLGSDLSGELSEILNGFCDVERILSKIAVGKVSPRQLLQLSKSIEKEAEIKTLLSSNKVLKKHFVSMKDCSEVQRLIIKHIYHDAPAVIGKGQLIADGVDVQLDEYRQLSTSGKDHLLALQKRESEATGIPSLKIAFNNVFGYYIEIRNAHKDKVPEEWIRKQTLVNAERYITEELKEFETKILEAEGKIAQIEAKIYQKVLADLCGFIDDLQHNAKLIAEIDVLNSFGSVSYEYNYCCPVVNDSLVLNVVEGRHPVIEQNLPAGMPYISNSLELNHDEQQIIMITGPNMSGKSALLRQTALIAIMAQIGCYVPAASAEIGIVDKVFTRVGASDNISTGESTFMVEMNETSNILNNLSERSLILLDEIGRGTSTYDGVSIAWAIAEYLHEYPLSKAKTLFATHYHELNEMTKEFSRIKNFNVSVKESKGKVIFMRKLVPGGSEHSFGIYVAKLAGMPKTVVSRAEKILAELEKNTKKSEGSGKSSKNSSVVNDMQLSFFQMDDPLLEQIKDEILELDVNQLTPIDALMKLNEIKRLLKPKK